MNSKIRKIIVVSRTQTFREWTKKYFCNQVFGSVEKVGYPNGLPNWGTYLGTPKEQIYQDY